MISESGCRPRARPYCADFKLKWAALPRARLSNLRSPVRSSSGDQNPETQAPGAFSSPLQQINMTSKCRSLSAAVTRLRKPELEQELQLRGLPSTGNRPDLRQRLVDALEAEKEAAQDAKPSVSKGSARPATHARAQTQVQLAVGQQTTKNTPAQPQQQATRQPANSNARHQPAEKSRQHHELKYVRMPSAASAQQPDTAAASAPHLASHTQPDRQQTSGTGQSVSPSLSSHMSVTWLGTSSGNPSLRRNVSSIALRHGSYTYLVDCGEGTSRQVLRSNIAPASVSAIYISHLHGDHCFGLPGMIELISEAHKAAGSAQGSKQLTIQGPPGVQQLVKTTLAASMSTLHMKLLVRDYTLDRAQARGPTPVDPTGFVYFARQAPDADSKPDMNPRARSRSTQNTHSNLQAHNVPVVPGLTWTTAGEGGMTVTAAQLQHRLPCWGYVFQEKPSQEFPGRKAVLLGDTCDSQAITAAGMGADMVSHECTFAAGMEKKAYVAQHSTAPMAGAFARSVRARALVLTHFSNRYSNKGEMAGQGFGADTEGDRQSVLQWLINQAREAYGSDRVWVANDFYTFEIRHVIEQGSRTSLAS